MAIEFMDNFSQYGGDESKMLDGIYASHGGGILKADPDGVSTGTVFEVHDDTGLRRVLSSAQTTVGVAFRLWCDALPTLSTTRPLLFQFSDATNAGQVSLCLETTGILTVKRGGTWGSTTLGASSVPVITAGAWNHVEMKVLFSQSGGTVEVRINGVQKISLTGQDTCATSNVECSQIMFTTKDSNGTNNGINFCIKDLLIWNDSGSLNNDFMGDCQIVSLLPDGDDSLNWTPSTGTTGYDLINETTPDDTDYIAADSTPPAASTFTLTDLEPEVVTVKGLMTFVRAFKTDGGTANLQVSMVSGVDEDAGSDRPITVTATTWSDISETDPATAAAWTPLSVNAAKLKIDRTT